MRVGVDTGGTFTDVVTDDGTVRKLPSTPGDPSRAVRRRLRGIVPGFRRRWTCSPTARRWRPTRCSNAGWRASRSVTTRGFADVIEIARQARPSLYDAHVDRPAALVPRALRFEVGGRLDADGHELEPFDGSVPDLGRRSTRWPCACSTPISTRATNGRSPRVLRGARPQVVCSHEVSPEFREYERRRHHRSPTPRCARCAAVPRQPRARSPTTCW